MRLRTIAESVTLRKCWAFPDGTEHPCGEHREEMLNVATPEIIAALEKCYPIVTDNDGNQDTGSVEANSYLEQLLYQGGYARVAGIVKGVLYAEVRSQAGLRTLQKLLGQHPEVREVVIDGMSRPIEMPATKFTSFAY